MKYFFFRWEKERIGEEGGGEISNGYTTDKWCDDDVTEKKKEEEEKKRRMVKVLPTAMPILHN